MHRAAAQRGEILRLFLQLLFFEKTQPGYSLLRRESTTRSQWTTDLLLNLRRWQPTARTVTTMTIARCTGLRLVMMVDGDTAFYMKSAGVALTRLTRSMDGMQRISGAKKCGAPGVLGKNTAGTHVACMSTRKSSRQLVYLLDQRVATGVTTIATSMFVESALLVVSVSSSTSTTEWERVEICRWR